MKANARRIAARALALAFVAATSSGCLVPDNAYLMELNRSGKWRTAEKVALDMLAHRGNFTHSQLRETYYHVIYARTRLGDQAEAAALAAEYDAFAAAGRLEPELLWLDREMAKLKDELGLLGPAAHTLVAAMTENGLGNYQSARELAAAVLAMADATEAQKATADFVAAICSIRLEDADAAAAHLAAFDALKGALPPGHQALAEEGLARQGLAELRAEK